MVTPLVVSEMVTVCGVAYVPDPGEKFGVFAEIVYAAVEVLLCEIPAPAAIALIVVVVEIRTGHGLVQEGEEVVGNDPLVV